MAALVLAVAGCGGDDDSSDGQADRPAPPASDFPAADGQTFGELVKRAGAGAEQELVVTPNTQVLEPGRNRFGFGVFTVEREEVPDVDVALYAAPREGGPALGPFPARVDSLEVDSQYESRNTAEDPDSARHIYVSDLKIPQSGEWDLLAMIRQGDQLSASLMPTTTVHEDDKIPDVGDRPPAVHTPTVDDVGGDLAAIDTREPHDSMHELDFADVVGERPVVLLFATPALCQSRVCGPVVDVEEQVKADTGDDVAFIHMEVYRDNDLNKGTRPQFNAFGLPTEPWLFVLDANGRVTRRIEGAFGLSELQDAVADVAD
jgi:hypothetical protein